MLVKVEIPDSICPGQASVAATLPNGKKMTFIRSAEEKADIRLSTTAELREEDIKALKLEGYKVSEVKPKPAAPPAEKKGAA